MFTGVDLHFQSEWQVLHRLNPPNEDYSPFGLFAFGSSQPGVELLLHRIHYWAYGAGLHLDKVDVLRITCRREMELKEGRSSIERQSLVHKWMTEKLY